MNGSNLFDGVEFISPIDILKKKVLAVQEYTFLSLESLGNIFRKPRYMADLLYQADIIGVGSVPIVIPACFFTGAALALNSAATLERFGGLSLIGQLVSIGIIRELGPVLAGLVVAGRNSSGMASELGSMKVTEQIDAMRSLGTDPMKKLVTPRVVATIFMLFFLTILGDFFGLCGGSIVATLILGLNNHQYWNNAWQTLEYEDVWIGLVKPPIFGFIIASIGCFFGMNASGGTQGVGKATTEAVVAAMILIIGVDVFLTRFMMIILGG